MRKTIETFLLLVLCVLIMTITLPVKSFGVSAIGGDINGDGSVNNKDLSRLFQHLSNWQVAVNADVLDVNNDGKVNNKDLTRLFQYLSGWNVEIFPKTVCVHTDTEWVTTKEATTSTTGEKTRVCLRCGITLETAVVPKISPPSDPKPNVTVTVHGTSRSVSLAPGTLVWLSGTGTKFHNKNNCGNMNPDKATLVTVETAVSQGRDACEKCYK